MAVAITIGLTIERRSIDGATALLEAMVISAGGCETNGSKTELITLTRQAEKI